MFQASSLHQEQGLLLSWSRESGLIMSGRSWEANVLHSTVESKPATVIDRNRVVPVDSHHFPSFFRMTPRVAAIYLLAAQTLRCPCSKGSGTPFIECLYYSITSPSSVLSASRQAIHVWARAGNIFKANMRSYLHSRSCPQSSGAPCRRTQTIPTVTRPTSHIHTNASPCYLRPWTAWKINVRICSFMPKKTHNSRRRSQGSLLGCFK
ncbi:hypothetical protein B0H11DRAFT_201444 [Mycena galericulata]|nr:hypothetical protein B0H11DRAFT_201444 [Mycena galericulata]